LLRTLGFDRGALYVRSPGGVLVPLAFEGDTKLEWPASTEPEGLFGEAWASEEPRQRDTGFDGSAGRWSAAIPLRIGLRTFGVVGMESDLGPFGWQELHTAMNHTRDGALRLETALLFEEVRSIATAEERRRVAREIHDGIAQELASLGYLVDDLSSRADVPELAEDLRMLRSQLTRMISELRLSIFDLRSEVQPSVGLGTALSDYVRQVGASSQLTVHLLLDEAPQRLGIETETELLRIAQEAITNARKHAGAGNLWVTCRVEPPSALLRVEDDGIGLGPGRVDSFGIEIMRERAERIGARLVVRDRTEGGAMVEVTLAGAR
jgi:signal transduction histidine kinase